MTTHRMLHKGLAKLIEECGELQQVAGKMLNYPDTDEHPDGKGSLKQRLMDEIGDVLAACDYVALRHGLPIQYLMNRRAMKLAQYQRWADDEALALTAELEGDQR